MRRKIIVEGYETRVMARMMGCTPRMVQRALAFDSDSPLALRIRRLALLRGGREVEYGLGDRPAQGVAPRAAKR